MPYDCFMVRWGHFRCFRGICSTKNETSCFVRIATPGPTTPLLCFQCLNHGSTVILFRTVIGCLVAHCVYCVVSEWVEQQRHLIVIKVAFIDGWVIFAFQSLYGDVFLCVFRECAHVNVCVCVCLFMTDCIRVASVQSEPGQNLLIQPPLGRKRGLRQVWTSPFFMCPMCPCNLMALSMCYLNSHLSKYITRKQNLKVFLDTHIK